MLRLAFAILIGCAALGAMMPAPVPAPAEPSVAGPVVEQGSRAEPGPGRVDLGSGVITLEREANGHFYADAQVNGTPVRFVVDTGASGIALSRDDAQRAGLLLDAEVEMVGSGASGAVYGRHVELDRVSLGIKEVRAVPAVVLEGGQESLLGQSFLAQFHSVRIEDDRMVLR